ncbi:hypothetical protein FV139_18525 [Parahaliea maris]|uniref:OmpA family protein n=1 Tax=Parahaliea maris TaxID=2716870 RepID=A0A5C8ZPQ1_9GAMM|nr:hypothetical protein [Parahaliea maris]TXS90255.1 hypothetical protein FV139_18525 [Parahaliea maris]
MWVDLRQYVAVALGVLWSASSGAGELLSFTACPVARDTGANTDLCFFTEYQGQRYALQGPSDWGRPELMHQVLVEGEVVEGEPVCGATVLSGRVSVLRERDLSCNEIVPFDGSVVGRARNLFERGSQAQRERAAGMMAALEENPALSIEAVIYDTPQPEPPQPPFTAQEMVIHFPFDSDRATGPDMMQFIAMLEYAVAAGGTVSIDAHQGESLTENAGVLAERQGMAAARASKLERIARRLGVPASSLHVTWRAENVPGDGRHDWESRRVDVAVIPPGGEAP